MQTVRFQAHMIAHIATKRYVHSIRAQISIPFLPRHQPQLPKPNNAFPLRLPHTRRPPPPLIRATALSPVQNHPLSIHRLPPPHKLISPIQLHFNRASHPQRTDCRPDTPLASQNPVVQTLLGRGLEQLQEVGSVQIGNERQARPRHVLVNQQAADCAGEET